MRRAWLLSGVLLIAATATARAQPPSRYTKDEALSLFNEARALMVEGRFAEACPKLEKAEAIDPGMGTLFNLSHCYEQIGRIASAWAGFRDVAAAARAAGQLDREQVARDRASALEPRLSKIRISVPDEAIAPGLSVQRDGVAVSRLLWGTDVPVDPGKHLVTATAPGRETWSSSVEVTGPGKVVILRVPPLAVLGGSTPSPPRTTEPPPPPDGRSAVPGVLLGVLAASGIGGGAALFALAGGKGSDAEALRAEIGTNGGKDNTCLAKPPPAKCADLDSVTRDEATFKGIAVGSFAAGGLAAAGLLLYVLWPSSSTVASKDGPPEARATRPVRLSLSAGPDGGRVFVVGSF